MAREEDDPVSQLTAALTQIVGTGGAAQGSSLRAITDADVDVLIAGSATGFSSTLGANATALQTSRFPFPVPPSAGIAPDGNPISINEATTRLITMDAASLKNLQLDLFRAGLYDAEDYRAGIDPQTGFPDPSTLKAYGQLLKAAVLEKRAGRSITDVMRERQIAFAPQLEKAGAGGGFNQVSVSDPAAIRVAADRIGTEVIGRKLTDEEKAAMVSIIQGAQAGAQQGAIDAAKGGASQATVTNVDAGARIEEELRRSRPAEAGASDFSSTMNDFFSLLGGPVNG